MLQSLAYDVILPLLLFSFCTTAICKKYRATGYHFRINESSPAARAGAGKGGRPRSAWREWARPSPSVSSKGPSIDRSGLPAVLRLTSTLNHDTSCSVTVSATTRRLSVPIRPKDDVSTYVTEDRRIYTYRGISKRQMCIQIWAVKHCMASLGHSWDTLLLAWPSFQVDTEYSHP